MAVNKWSLTSLCSHCWIASHYAQPWLAFDPDPPASHALWWKVSVTTPNFTLFSVLAAVASVGLYGQCVLNGPFPRFFGHKAHSYPKISLKSVEARGTVSSRKWSGKRCLDRRCPGSLGSHCPSGLPSTLNYQTEGGYSGTCYLCTWEAEAGRSTKQILGQSGLTEKPCLGKKENQELYCMCIT